MKRAIRKTSFFSLRSIYNGNSIFTLSFTNFFCCSRSFSHSRRQTYCVCVRRWMDYLFINAKSIQYTFARTQPTQLMKQNVSNKSIVCRRTILPTTVRPWHNTAAAADFLSWTKTTLPLSFMHNECVHQRNFLPFVVVVNAEPFCFISNRQCNAWCSARSYLMASMCTFCSLCRCQSACYAFYITIIYYFSIGRIA